MANFTNNLFDRLLDRYRQENAPVVEPLQMADDGSIDNVQALALQQKTQPLTIGQRFFGRELTKDVQHIDPQTGEATMETIKNYKPGLLEDIAAGYKENRNTPFALNNLQEGQKGFATRIGEGLGSFARFADSPAGRALLMGGIVGATGGNGLQALAYGTTTGAGNRQNRTADTLYRNQLESEGIDTSNIKGYINSDTFKNYSLANYRNNSLAVRQQLGVLKDNTSRAKFIGNLLNNGMITPKEAMQRMAEYGIQIEEMDASNQTKLLPFKQEYYQNAINNPLGWANYGLKADKEAREQEIQDVVVKYLDNLNPNKQKPTAQGGMVRVKAPNGKIGSIPASNLEKALKQGYTKI